jgi:hypothetical protein
MVRRFLPRNPGGFPTAYEPARHGSRTALTQDKGGVSGNKNHESKGRREAGLRKMP